MKSGGHKYHGQVSDFVRNTAFDTWCFTSKAATVRNAQGQTIPLPSQSSTRTSSPSPSAARVPHTGNKLFFFVAYDRFHSRSGANPSLYTIPTTLMRTGDFTGGVGAATAGT